MVRVGYSLYDPRQLLVRLQRPVQQTGDGYSSPRESSRGEYRQTKLRETLLGLYLKSYLLKLISLTTISNRYVLHHKLAL